ncbi:MAG: arginine N-succinyltransferase [Gammaproteobacteria bacterium]|nr:arginine N-succinyltransferase [Gammaproteobacteria bacterium]
MFVIRPIQQKDFSELYAMAEESGHGFTSLPVNEELITNRIKRAEDAVSNPDANQPGEFGYLFVMEDTETGAIMGTCGIESSVGLSDAFYHYHLSKVVHNSRELNIYNTAEILTLCNDYTGAAELCTLFLREPYRKGVNGRVLSKSRFLFLAQNQHRFSETVIAEMRGVSDESGESPFWEWLEKHFFSMDFPTADYLTGIGQKVFIAELMPKYPVYVSLLSDAAQQVIGKVHPKTKPALKLLKSEGFNWNGYVDIFDAGPTVECDLNQIRTVRHSGVYTVNIVDSIENSASDKSYIMLSNTEVQNYRATAIPGVLDEQSTVINLDIKTAELLHVEQNAQVRAVNLL